MTLNQAQRQALATDIANDVTLNAIQKNSDGFATIAAAYNAVFAPTFFVYRTNIPAQDIYDQIVWANLTPTDPPTDPTPANDTAITLQRWHNRSLACQGKQFNVQTMLMGQLTINGAKTNVRAGLQDALTNVPSSAGGATVSAGWVGVRDNALARAATRGEKLFATGGTGADAAHAATMAQEGNVSAADVEQALGL